MNPVWYLLKHLPPGILRLIKRCTNSNLRLWLRNHLGGDASTIPDAVITVRDGRRFHIGPDRIYWPLYLGLEYEPELSAIFRRLLRPGDTVLDIGANYGWYTTLFASAVCDTGRVIAFEPVPSTCARLRENTVLNHLAHRVTAMQAAVSETAGQARIFMFGNESHSNASLMALHQDDVSSCETPVIRLDDLLEQEGVRRVQLLKCDVEGSELAVLKGARNLLRSDQAPILAVELNDETCQAFGYVKNEIWHFLTRMGYDRFYEPRANCNLRRLTGVEQTRNVTMLLAAKGEILEQRLSGRSAAKMAA